MKWDSVLRAAEKLWELARHKDVQEFARRLWDIFSTQKPETYEEDNADVVAKALHRMRAGRPPRIVLVGMTSAGKSSLTNALFGRSVAVVRRTADTTNCVLEVTFPSGLVIYDTPGIAGNEVYENITRAFLGLEQDPELGVVSRIPFLEMGARRRIEIPLERLRERAPAVDGVMFVVDVSRTLTRPDKQALKSFYHELVLAFPDRVVAAGTHADALDSASAEEREGMLSAYRHVTGGSVIPVSATVGTGLGELVIALFQSLPDMVSLSKMQESLANQRKLGRLSFVINEAAGMLAEIAFMKGSQAKEIKLASLCMFATICNHYAVDEATWMAYHGNASQLGEEARKKGERVQTRIRDPRGFWERVQVFFGKTFTYETREYERVGSAGVAVMLPGVYNLLYEFSMCTAPKLADQEVAGRLVACRKAIDDAMSRDSRGGVATQVRAVLASMLPSS